jgi:hypothetical protein
VSRQSTCCGYPPSPLSPDICGRCKEHADFEDEDGELRPPRDERAMEREAARLEAEWAGQDADEGRAE